MSAEGNAGALSLLSILFVGFLLGMRHATDADHVVAVSTIVSRERSIRSAAWIGAMWGAGHTITILAVGIGIVYFTLSIPARLGLSMELSVGLMLIVLGFANLRRSRQITIAVLHDHADIGVREGLSPEIYCHAAGTASLDRMDGRFGRWRVYRWARPLVVGLVHGLAGSAAIALLVLTTIHDSRWAAAYLLVFGIGTIAGMMAITMAMASALSLAGSRSVWINRRLSLATGLVSLAFGFLVVYQMGVVHGLFTSHPTWFPE